MIVDICTPTPLHFCSIARTFISLVNFDFCLNEQQIPTMDIETSNIPTIQIENIGSRKKPLYAIKGSIELATWTNYFLYDESYKLIQDKVVTNGRINLWIGNAITSAGSFQISQAQVNAYFYLVDHQQQIKASIIENLKKKFPDLLSNEYASWEQREPYFPNVSALTPAFDFMNYIGPESISIHDDVKDELAYVTWNFRCRWDIEHGFGVITHKDRIIDIAPTVDIWKIYKDNGTYNQARKEYQEKERTLPKKKKWWQF